VLWNWSLFFLLVFHDRAEYLEFFMKSFLKSPITFSEPFQISKIIPGRNYNFLTQFLLLYVSLYNHSSSSCSYSCLATFYDHTSSTINWFSSLHSNTDFQIALLHSYFFITLYYRWKFHFWIMDGCLDPPPWRVTVSTITKIFYPFFEKRFFLNDIQDSQRTNFAIVNYCFNIVIL
jgi:hypothetical protein